MQTRFIYAALGFGSGAAISWAITADIYDKRLKEKQTPIVNVYNTVNEANEPAVEVEYVDPNQTSLVIDQRNLTDPYLEPDQEEAPESIDAVKAVESLETVKNPNVQNLIEEYSADPEAKAEFAAMTEAVSTPNSSPIVITRDEFAYDEEGQHYAKITLTYYPRDRVLLDDAQEPMDNIVGMVGWRNLNRFGDESGDPNVVFVRNNKMETDFEIVREDDTPLPLHVTYGMEKEEFNVHKAAGLLKLRQEDE